MFFVWFCAAFSCTGTRTLLSSHGRRQLRETSSYSFASQLKITKKITIQHICYTPCSYEHWINFPQSRISSLYVSFPLLYIIHAISKLASSLFFLIIIFFCFRIQQTHLLISKLPLSMRFAIHPTQVLQVLCSNLCIFKIYFCWARTLKQKTKVHLQR